MSGRKSHFRGNERFDVIRTVGVGGMGVVYEAFDRSLNTRVALKTLRQLSSRAIRGLREEFSVAQSIDHPNLVRLGELVEHESEWFYTMELIAGVDFLHYVRGRAGGVDYDRLRDVLGQMARVLAVVHSTDRVHRDIKPSNILVTAEGRAVLMDFGLATELVAGRQLGDVGAGGTLEYMAPEQAAGRPVSTASDWYSLGVMLYQALTGSLPHRGTRSEIVMAKMSATTRHPFDVVSSTPADLDELCVGLLQAEPGDRLGATAVLGRLGLQDCPEAELARQSERLIPVPVFVGRARELARLDDAARACGEGRYRGCLVLGEAGIGKTSLVSEFVAAQQSSGDSRLLVLRERCYQGVASSFKAFDSVVRGISKVVESVLRAAISLPDRDDAWALAQVFPAFSWLRQAAFRGGTSHSHSPQVLRMRAFATLRALTREVAQRRRVIIFIDDLQWADADSFALLQELLLPPDTPPLLFIATARSEDYDRIGDRLPRLELIEVGGLAEADALALINAVADRGTLSSEAASGLVRESAGHPFFLTQMARNVAGRRATEPGGASLEAVLMARIAALTKLERLVLELVSVAGVPIDEHDLVSAGGITMEDGIRAVATLHESQLLQSASADRSEGIEVFHDRVRETVVKNLRSPQSQRHHASWARVLSSRAMRKQEPMVLVRHLEAAGHADQAATQAEEAGHRSSDTLAFDQAATFLRVALRLGSHTARKRRELTLDLADAICNAGNPADASAVYLEATVGADAAVRLNCQRRAVEQLIAGGHIEPGIELLASMLASVGESLSRTPRQAVSSLLWLRLRLRLRGLRWTERQESELSPEGLLRVDTVKAAAQRLSMVDPVRGAQYTTRFVVLALNLGECTRVCSALSHEAMFCAAQGGRGVARARLLMNHVRAIAARRANDRYINAVAVGSAGIVSYLEGRFTDAEARLGQAVEEFRRGDVGTAHERNNVRLFHLIALRALGELAKEATQYRDYLHDAQRRGDAYLEANLCFYTGTKVALAGDDVEGARTVARLPHWSTDNRSVLIVQWYQLESSLDISLYDGSSADRVANGSDELDKIDRSLLARVQVVRVYTMWLRARLLLSGPRNAETVREIDALIRGLARQRIGYALVFSKIVAAALATWEWRRDLELAHKLLGEAAIHAADIDMQLFAVCARYRLAALLGGDAGQGLQCECDGYFVAQGIKRPDSYVRMFAPGFVEAK